MPITPTYPGVYVTEAPAGAPTISGVSTSNTAFIDYFPRGPINQAVPIASFTDFESAFGSLDARSEASYQIMQYYLNGGQNAYVVRVTPQNSGTADVDLLPQGVILPAIASLSASQQQQFVATIPGGACWSICDPTGNPPCDCQNPLPAGTWGSIDPNSGLYTAPPTILTQQTVTVMARGINDCSATPQATITLVPVSVAIKSVFPSQFPAPAVPTKAKTTVVTSPPTSPPTFAEAQGAVTVGPGETISFTATVAGTSRQAVTWDLVVWNPASSTLDPATGVGSIDGTGLYSAPAAWLSGSPADFGPKTFLVRATSHAGPAAASSVQEVVFQPVHVVAAADFAVSPEQTPGPGPAPSVPNQSVTFTAYFDPSMTPSWQNSINVLNTAPAPCNCINCSTYCFKAPANQAPNSTTTVTCNVSIGSNQVASDSVEIRLEPQYKVKVKPGPGTLFTNADPAQPTVEAGNNIQFLAITAGDASNAVTWKASAGAITRQGFFTAPASFPDPNLDSLAVTITATSSNDPAATPQFDPITVVVTKPVSRFRALAASPGVWGNQLQVAALLPRNFSAANPTFNLQCQLLDAAGNVKRSELHTALSMDPTSSQYAVTVVNNDSAIINLLDLGPDHQIPFLQTSPPIFQPLSGGDDGSFAAGELATAIINQVTDDSALLSNIAPDLFNILCIPATSDMSDDEATAVIAAAQAYCQDKRAFLIIDIPPSQEIGTPRQMEAWFESNLSSLSLAMGCAAIYYPRIYIKDPLNDYRPRESAYSGTMAGVYATTDLNRGVWKAPAGIQAIMAGADPVYPMKDSDNGVLNPLGINAIRSFPVYNVISWGARTVQGADELSSQWKYIPVRRLAQYIENSLYQGLTWAVFEPNDTPLWSDIVFSVTGFMSNLFRQGAFQGGSPKEAFFVQCDASTTTQYDIDRGIVNVIVGFAPLKPAEFVVLQLQQIAGQAAS